MSKKNIIIAVSSVLIVLLGAAAVFAAPAYDAFFSKKSVKNIVFNGKNAGALTKEQIFELVSKEAENKNNITVEVNGEKITFDNISAGIKLDAEKTAEKIMTAGKKNIKDTMKLRKGAEITPVFSCDEKILSDVVETQLSEKGMSFVSYVVDVKNTTADFTVLTENTPLDFKKLGADIVALCEKNKGDFEVKAEFSEFVWPAAEELRDDFDVEMQNASKVTENGEVKYQSHIVGRKIDFEALKKALDEKKTQFSVPYEKVLPKVYTEDLGDEGFPDLLGKYSSYYSEGDWGRSVNVKLAASKINGYIMNSGETFSFNGVVGKRTYANGFKDANVYSANGVENGVGGGICQVSSTLYAAVLYSDLKIVSRRNHSYVVSYMPAGLDATVSYGTIDFLFRNDKKNPIKIKAVASGGLLTVRIYGTKENNNTIVLESKTISYTPRGEKRVFDETLPLGKEKVDHSGYDGLKARVYKYTKSADGTILKTEDLGVSTYVPLNKIIKYNNGINPNEEKVQEDIPQEPQIPENSSDGETVIAEEELPTVDNQSELTVPDIPDVPASENNGLTAENADEGQASENNGNTVEVNGDEEIFTELPIESSEASE